MKKITVIFSLAIFLLLNSVQVIGNEVVVKSGHLNKAFSSWGKPSLQGSWKIVTTEEKTFIELGEDFKAKDGPDVKIFLSPQASENITGKNATEGSIFIRQIFVFEGKTRIEFPTGIRLDDYQSLVFHCEEYSKLWGVSPL